MFSQASVILLTGGGRGVPHTPREQTLPRSRPPEQTPPMEQTSPGADPPRADTPLGADTPRADTLPPPASML